MRRFTALLLALLLGLGNVQGSQAQAPAALPQPTGSVILTVSGAITRGNGSDAQGRPVAHFDRAMLEALGHASIETTTPWHKGVVRFEGVPGPALIEAVGAKPDGIAQAVALNDYASAVPVADFMARGLILALKQDGTYMTVREKGPIFIVYPYDNFPDLRQETFYTRSVWQLRRLDIR